MTSSSFSSSSNIGVQTNTAHDLWVGAVPDPGTPGPSEVLVHVRACGICGSDVHFWKEGQIGPMVVTGDQVLGHEASGEVISIGNEVKDLKPGDRVAFEPGEACMSCERCKSGAYNGCDKVLFKSTPPVPGELRRYMVHPASLCYKIGELSYAEGALLEPLSVAISGLDLAGVRLGYSVLVAGAGPIGTLCALLSKAAGATAVVVTDLNEKRLDFVKKIAPSILTLAVKQDWSPREVAEQAQKLAGGIRFSKALECTGFESSIAAGILALDFRGTIQLLGVGKDEIKIPFMHVSVNEITIRGLYRYTNTWPKAIRMVQAGLIDLKPLISHEVPLEEATRAFGIVTDPSKGAIKVLIVDKS